MTHELVWCLVWQRSEAVEILERSVTRIEALFTKTHPQIVPLSLGLSWAYKEQGRTREAMAWAKRAAVVAHQSYTKSHPRRAEAQSAVAQVLMMQGQYEVAADKLQLAIRAQCAAGCLPGHSSIARDRSALAECLAAVGRYEDALEQAELAHDTRVLHAAGPREREVALLSNLAARARIHVLQGFFETAAAMAHKLLQHHEYALMHAPSAHDLPPTPPASSHTHDAYQAEGGLGPRDHPRKTLQDTIETHTLRIAAELVLTQVCRVKGQLHEAVQHALLARQLASSRYLSSHPIAIEAALEWARAHCALGASLTAQEEALEVLLEAQNTLLVHYVEIPHLPPNGAPRCSDAGAPQTNHPLCVNVCAAKAEIMSANNMHAAAVEEARKSTALHRLFLPAHASAPHRQTNWVSFNTCDTLVCQSYVPWCCVLSGP